MNKIQNRITSQAVFIINFFFMKPIQFNLKSTKASSLSKMNEEKIATFAFGNITKSKYQTVFYLISSIGEGKERRTRKKRIRRGYEVIQRF